MPRRVDIWKPALVALFWTFGAFVVVPASAASAAPVLYRLPPATHAGTPAVGVDGTVWFDLFHGPAFGGDPGSSIGRLSPGGAFSEFPLPEGRAAGAPVAAPDGEIWFPERYAGEQGYGVARLSTSGQLQEYRVGEGGGAIGSVVPLDGDLWFVATPRNEQGVRGRTVIGRVEAATGVVKPEVVLKPNCFSATIAAAAGAVWFTESCRWESLRADIGRIDKTGKVVRYRLAKEDHPTSIAFGPRGVVWFGATSRYSSDPRIGRIKSRGAVVEYPVPDGWPVEIAVGPGGRLWFPSTFGGGVRRALASIGKRGDISKAICVDPECRLGASGLGTGPDGSLWFSAEGQHTVGGGGFTQILQGEAIANEAGFVGRLGP